MNQWVTPKEIALMPDMPSSIQGVHKRAKKEGWQKRPVIGRQGAGVEYLLPQNSSEAPQPSKTREQCKGLAATLELMISKLNTDEIHEMERNIILNGLGGLIKKTNKNNDITSEMLDVLGLDITDIKLARVLHGLPEKQRREILSKYGIDAVKNPSLTDEGTENRREILSSNHSVPEEETSKITVNSDLNDVRKTG